MKNISTLLSILFSFLCISCINSENSKKDSNNTYTKPSYIIAEIVDSVIVAHPESFNNDINRKKTAEEIQNQVINAIKSNHSALTELPLEFERMMKKGNKYIVKFHLSSWSKKTKISDKYNISFNVFAEIPEEQASDLVEKTLYHLTFKSVTVARKNLILPSGNTFTESPSVRKSPTLSDEEEINVNLIGLLLKDINFTIADSFEIE